MSSDFETPSYISKIAKVKEVVNSETTNGQEQVVKLEIYNPKSTNDEVYITNVIPANQAFAILAKKDHKYIVTIDNESNQVYISDYYREPTVIGLIIIFIITVIAIGRSKGVKALLSLALTGLGVVYIFIPAIKNHWEPIPIAILVSAFATLVTMILIAGFNKKSLAATLGTVGGVTIAGFLGIIATKIAPLSGLASQEAQILLANQTETYDFQGILAAGVLISSLGAAMDVAISIASATQEIHETDLNQSSRALFQHAMNVGKDIMGTMINTLILAYAGSSVPLFLILYNQSQVRFLNLEIIATELISATAGSIGLILAIPITAAISVFLLKKVK